MMSFCAERPFLLNSPCCRPLHSVSPSWGDPRVTVTVIGYSSILFPTTFASGCTCRTAAFAASNSCWPPSQLEQNVTVYVSPVPVAAVLDTDRTISFTLPRKARAGVATTWRRAIEGPWRGLKSRRADTAAAEVSVKPPIVRPAPVTTAARLELNSNKMCPRSPRNTCVRTSKSHLQVFSRPDSLLFAHRRGKVRRFVIFKICADDMRFGTRIGR